MSTAPKQAIEALRAWAKDLEREIAEHEQHMARLKKLKEDAESKLLAIETLSINGSPAPKNAGILDDQPTGLTSITGLPFRQAVLTVIRNSPTPIKGSLDVERALHSAGYNDASPSKHPLKQRIAAEVSKLIKQHKVARGNDQRLLAL